MPALCSPYSVEKPFPIEQPLAAEKSRRGPVPGYPHPDLATLVSLWDLMGCHEIRTGIRVGISSVKRASAVPKPVRRFTT
jgi:hypothetical protein